MEPRSVDVTESCARPPRGNTEPPATFGGPRLRREVQLPIRDHSGPGILLAAMLLLFSGVAMAALLLHAHVAQFRPARAVRFVPIATTTPPASAITPCGVARVVADGVIEYRACPPAPGAGLATPLPELRLRPPESPERAR